MKNYLTDLKESHRKVEELTIANERQRMARDLHDTLAQGVAGLLLQLGAADAHLVNGNTVRSQQIIQKAMDSARKTLKDARGAIDDLRYTSNQNINFNDDIQIEVNRFTQNLLTSV